MYIKAGKEWVTRVGVLGTCHKIGTPSAADLANAIGGQAVKAAGDAAKDVGKAAEAAVGEVAKGLGG